MGVEAYHDGVCDVLWNMCLVLMVLKECVVGLMSDGGDVSRALAARESSGCR